ncbi:MAG TPA: hypothetical protein GX719_09715, partial [Gammaproteobacteria bacterium]|nr:hypothetical protein [Gammaproteobacteria bacterium]
ERAVILCEGNQVTTELMGIDVDLAAEKSTQDASAAAEAETKAADSTTATASTKTDAEPEVVPSELSLEDYFQHFVLEHQDQMTETELARKLGISRKCLWERRQRFGIPRRKSSGA